MARFTVTISCDNAAFDPRPQDEVSRILRMIAHKVMTEGFSGFYETILDVHGNDVGRFAMKEDDGGNWCGRREG